MKLYADWAEQAPTMKAVLVFDTMWGSTASMAAAIADGLHSGGAEPRLLPLGASHRSDVATELLDAGALIVGSPTINNCVFPTVADTMTYLKGLRPKNILASSFGSYGWSGEALGWISDALDAMKVERIGDGIKVQYVPGDDDLARCRRLGEDIAQRLGEILGGAASPERS
jgi:flavorubredoxin